MNLKINILVILSLLLNMNCQMLMRYYPDSYDNYFKKNEMRSLHKKVNLNWIAKSRIVDPYESLDIVMAIGRANFFSFLPYISQSGNLVFDYIDPEIISYNSTNGKEIWRFSIGENNYAKIFEDGNNIYLGAMDKIYAFAKQNYELLWEYPCNFTQNILFDSLFMYVFSSGQGQGTYISKLDKFSGELIQDHKLPSKLVSSYIDADIFINTKDDQNNNTLFVYNKDNITDMKWSLKGSLVDIKKDTLYIIHRDENTEKSVLETRDKSDRALYHSIELLNFDGKYISLSNNIILYTACKEINDTYSFQIIAFNKDKNDIIWQLNLNSILKQSFKDLYSISIQDSKLTILGMNRSGKRQQAFLYEINSGEQLLKAIMPESINGFRYFDNNVMITTANGWLYAYKLMDK